MARAWGIYSVGFPRMHFEVLQVQTVVLQIESLGNSKCSNSRYMNQLPAYASQNCPALDPNPHMGGCQNYGPFLGPYYNTAPII